MYPCFYSTFMTDNICYTVCDPNVARHECHFKEKKKHKICIYMSYD